MTTNSNTKGTAMKLGVMTLAIMNVAAVVSLRGLPAEAVYGLSSAFYYLFAAIVFLVPTALVAAELAAMFAQKEGGVFRWVGEAYGKRFGFLAIFLQWIEYDLVPDGSDIRGRIHRIHRLEHLRRCPAGIQQNLHAGYRAGYLLGSNFYLAERTGMGR